MNRTHAPRMLTGDELLRVAFPKAVTAQRIAIVGSRTFPELAFVARFVESLPENTLVISGGAKGVDSAAEAAAKRVRLSRLIYEPRWKLHGNTAGVIRNQLIVKAAEHVVCFWDQKSKGTKTTIDIATEQGVPLTVINGAGVKVN